ncbi:hypothetical protein [Vibrio maerlii]|uniref:hypothetical protein n=1 Tax=Vibrio maerlii TaxID=2231648 RepID=UPI000E3D51D9|nr:hypothetical protein [Vibrio maerlii]
MKTVKAALLATTIAFSPIVVSWDQYLDDPESELFQDWYPYTQISGQSFSDSEESGLANSSVQFFPDPSSRLNTHHIFDARVGYNTDGQQQLYIVTTYPCEATHRSGETAVLKVNGQNVRFNAACNLINYAYYTIATATGTSYVVNEFKRASTVSIHIPYKDTNRGVPFSAAGFTKLWNSYGGGAL